MQRLSRLGRELREAQTDLAYPDFRNLAEQRRRLIADLLDRAQAHAAEAGVRLTPTVLSEVEATLQAALVDLAGALTIRNGRLVRPLSHSGFGRRPRVPQLGRDRAAGRRGAGGSSRRKSNRSSRTSWPRGAARWPVCGSSSS